MNSEQFQTLALGWISALTATVAATGYAAAKLWPVIADIKARFDGLKDRVDRHGERLQIQDQTIAAVALATPVPEASAPDHNPSPTIQNPLP